MPRSSHRAMGRGQVASQRPGPTGEADGRWAAETSGRCSSTHVLNRGRHEGAKPAEWDAREAVRRWATRGRRRWEGVESTWAGCCESAGDRQIGTKWFGDSCGLQIRRRSANVGDVTIGIGRSGAVGIGRSGEAGMSRVRRLCRLAGVAIEYELDRVDSLWRPTYPKC